MPVAQGGGRVMQVFKLDSDGGEFAAVGEAPGGAGTL